MTEKMKFAPRELCEKLEAMGCKSDSAFYYSGNKDFSEEWIVLPRVCFAREDLPFKTQAFTQNDFTGATEQARKNAEIVWPDILDPSSEDADGNYTEVLEQPSKELRHAMIDSDNWVEYLERTMRG